MWSISRIFVLFYLQPRYRFSKSRDSIRFPKPPFVIVSNHGTFFDPWIVGYYIPCPFAIMCNDEAFSRGTVSRWYLSSIGAFPKKKGASDFRAMKKTLSRLATGYPVLIFPEGQTSWDGNTQLIYKGIEKIVRKSGAALVMARITGNFLTKPWWADVMRKGKIVVKFDVVTRERIRALSDDELFGLMKSGISHDDIKDPANAHDVFSGTNLALGLERFVWICPGCHKEDTLATAGNHIRCDSCGRAWTMDAVCRLTPVNEKSPAIGDLADWAEWHRTMVLEKIAAAKLETVLTVSSGVHYLSGKDNFSFVDEGVCSALLTSSTLSVSFDNGGIPSRSFPVAEIINVVIQKKDIVEFGYDGMLYRLEFKHHSSMKWIYYLRYLKGYRKFEEQGYIG